ncbi:MAG: DUF362 domain-containing protein [Elusimicrobiota bacterium]
MRFTRREFIKAVSVMLVGLVAKKLSAAERSPVSGAVGSLLKKGAAAGEKKYELSIIKGTDHAAITRQAVSALGGMEKFVKKGDTVVVKPNMCGPHMPEMAATTNPEVVKEIVYMCYEAGAVKVKVFDKPFRHAGMTYKICGIARAAKEAGADVFFVDDWNYVNAKFEYDSPLEGWPIYKDAIEADCFINVPILKHHSYTGLTLSMKNLMGVMGGNRGNVHWDISTKLAHLTDYIKPKLIVMDATRVLMRNGPGGGNLEDVEIFNTVMASADPVLIDSEAARLVGVTPKKIGCIRVAGEMGLGKFNVSPDLVYRKQV